MRSISASMDERKRAHGRKALKDIVHVRCVVTARFLSALDRLARFMRLSCPLLVVQSRP
jgi:hypothetical protein